MRGKYPSLTPYNYCASNPIILVDFVGDSVSMTFEAWKVQEQAFLSVFDKKKDKNPFSYDKTTHKMYFTGEKENHTYSDSQREIIDHYKSLCESQSYNVNVQVVNNNDPIETIDGTSSLSVQSATGITIDRGNSTADVYISSQPQYLEGDKIRIHPQKEDHQSITILHEIGGHAYYHSQGIHGNSNNELTTNFENLCRKIFLGKWGSNEIRKGSASYEHE